MIPIKNENPKILVKKVKMDNDKNQKSKILKLGGLSYHPPQAGVKMGLTVCWRPTSWRSKWTICCMYDKPIQYEQWRTNLLVYTSIDIA